VITFRDDTDRVLDYFTGGPLSGTPGIVRTAQPLLRRALAHRCPVVLVGFSKRMEREILLVPNPERIPVFSSPEGTEFEELVRLKNELRCRLALIERQFGRPVWQFRNLERPWRSPEELRMQRRLKAAQRREREKVERVRFAQGWAAVVEFPPSPLSVPGWVWEHLMWEHPPVSPELSLCGECGSALSDVVCVNCGVADEGSGVALRAFAGAVGVFSERGEGARLRRRDGRWEEPLLV